jgi:hypothetical protein
MRRMCSVHPDPRVCRDCAMMGVDLGFIQPCSKCSSNSPANTDGYEIIDVGTSFFSGDYAVVLKDGVMSKVSLSRIYNVELV